MSQTTIETTTEPTIRYNDQGLVPAIVQDVDSGDVLMMAWMNEAAVRSTLETRKATFYSRSRDKMWVKGESSGHVQEVQEMRLDCDQDTILLRVKAHGPACHAGYKSCFYRNWNGETDRLDVVEKKVFDPNDVYKS
ncbi:MAG: phosphoribosyl-AMP cyclohydrolase [Phycisphaera sp.]|nr:phosphoribosyl-AMP cyclohydrolase [Phycisphaera sp.]